MKTAYIEKKEIITKAYLFQLLLSGGVIKSKETFLMYRLKELKLFYCDNNINFWIRSDSLTDRYLEFFTLGDFIEMEEIQEIQEPTPPKFTPENIMKIWICDTSSQTFLTNNILIVRGDVFKKARLATHEEIQSECDRLNKICEEK